MIDVQRVDYIRIPVTDMEKANHFYGELLGLERNPNSPGDDWVEYETGNVTLAVMTPHTHDYEFTPLPPGTIALGVPDVAEAKAKLEAAGVEVNEMWDSGVCHGAGSTIPPATPSCCTIATSRTTPEAAGGAATAASRRGRPTAPPARSARRPHPASTSPRARSRRTSPPLRSPRYTTSKPSVRLPTMTMAHGPSPAPTKVCSCPGRAMDEVPLLQAALLTFDHEQAFAGDDEEVLLAALAVVQAVLTGPENLDPEAELSELLLPLEVGVLPAVVAADPGRVARVEHEPAVALDHEAELGLLQLRLGNGRSSGDRV